MAKAVFNVRNVATSTVGLATTALVGLTVGLAGFTFVYAKGSSYLTNDPAACANCHVMQEHFDGWTKSSHRAVAACNDCHTPPGLVGKYATKASNGFWHSYAFTLGDFHEPIQIKPSNREVTEQACRGCHHDVVHALEPGQTQKMTCIHCHRSVGHL